MYDWRLCYTFAEGNLKSQWIKCIYSVIYINLHFYATMSAIFGWGIREGVSRCFFQGENPTVPIEADGRRNVPHGTFCLLPSLCKKSNCLSGSTWPLDVSAQSHSHRLNSFICRWWSVTEIMHFEQPLCVPPSLTLHPDFIGFDTKKWTLQWLSSNYSGAFWTVQCIHAPN